MHAYLIAVMLAHLIFDCAYTNACLLVHTNACP